MNHRKYFLFDHEKNEFAHNGHLPEIVISLCDLWLCCAGQVCLYKSSWLIQSLALLLIFYQNL